MAERVFEFAHPQEPGKWNGTTSNSQLQHVRPGTNVRAEAVELVGALEHCKTLHKVLKLTRRVNVLQVPFESVGDQQFHEVQQTFRVVLPLHASLEQGEQLDDLPEHQLAVYKPNTSTTLTETLAFVHVPVKVKAEFTHSSAFPNPLVCVLLAASADDGC